MSVLRECSRLVRAASRKTRVNCFIQQARPISIATSRCLLLRQNGLNRKFTAHYAQWTPNIVRSHEPSVPLPEIALVDCIWSKVERWPNQTAMVCGVSGREVKYSELKEQCNKVAVSFCKDLGLKSGQVIATILPNIIEYPPVILGALEAGIIVSPINPLYTADEIAYQIKDSGAVMAVTFPEKLSVLQEVKAKLGLDNFEIVVVGSRDPLPEGIKSYKDLLANANLDYYPEVKQKKFTMDDTVIIPYSSGTTGQPKGVCLTNKNLVANIIAMYVMREIEDTNGNHQDVLPLLLPIFHIYGFTVVLAQALYCGSKIIMLPKFEEETFLRALKDYKTTVLYVAPPLVIYLGNSPNVTEDHLKSVRVILSGAAPVGELDILKCLKKSPKNVTYKQGYGLTETAPAVCSMIKSKTNYSSVGPPVVNTSVKVIDIQTKQALGNNEEGEICVKGPQVMKKYWNNKKATDEVIDEEGWFHTGDIGYYDSEGFFYITDRLKELIKVKGFQVAPAELESVLRSHPDIADAGVIGVPHERNGEAPIGFIKTKTGQKLDVESIKSFLKGKIAKYKQIEYFVFVEAIPKSAAGKILRKDLKAMYLNSK